MFNLFAQVFLRLSLFGLKFFFSKCSKKPAVGDIAAYKNVYITLSISSTGFLLKEYFFDLIKNILIIKYIPIKVRKWAYLLLLRFLSPDDFRRGVGTYTMMET